MINNPICLSIRNIFPIVSLQCMSHCTYILGVVVVVEEKISLKNKLLILFSETCKRSVSSEKKNRFYDFSVEKMSRLFWENCSEIYFEWG